MGEKISRLFFYGLSFLLMYYALIFCRQKDYINTVCILILSLIANPFITDKISKKIGTTRSNYWYAFRMMFNFCGILLAFIIAMSLYEFTDMSNIDDELKEFSAIFKISVYLVYLLVLFLWKNSDKYLKYLIFGCFYLLCVMLSFFTETFHSYILEMLNSLPDSNLDIVSYNILINDILVPIKEAILTYIIFDTVIIPNGENSKKKREELDVIEVESKEEVNPLDEQGEHFFAVNVQDNGTRESKEYLIKINKK